MSARSDAGCFPLRGPEDTGTTSDEHRKSVISHTASDDRRRTAVSHASSDEHRKAAVSHASSEEHRKAAVFHADSDAHQKAAISHGRGPCAVIAGPGSGKTHVIVGRICHLIECCGAFPSSILVLTFSRAAAEEMRSRFLKRCADRQAEGASSPLAQTSREVVFGTFHAVFYRILQESGQGKLHMIDPAVKRNFLRHLCETQPDLWGGGRSDGAGHPTSGRLPPDMTPEELQLLISRCKNGLPCTRAWVPALVRAYDNYLASRGCLDFDDMILRCHALLSRDPDLLEHWRKRFTWILVDEFQDVSRMQYEALRLLAAPENNLFVVGDDDQSIYGFRGADPGTMRRFLMDYQLSGTKNAALQDTGKTGISSRIRRMEEAAEASVPPHSGSVIYLNTNYRCDRTVLQAAASLIRANNDRIPKKFRAGRREKGNFCCRPFSGREQQYAFLAGELAAMTPADRGRTAVIFRTHSGALGFLDVLERCGIPFAADQTQKKRLSRTCEEEILGDLAAWYRAGAGLDRQGASRRDLLRIMNRPERFLSGSFAALERMDRRALLDHAGFEYDAILELADDLSLLDSLPPALSMRYLLESVGYRDYAESVYQKTGSAARVHTLLTDLCREAASCPNAVRWLARLERPYDRPDNGEPLDPQNGAVRILTMHACKGLEFDSVYIPDLNEGNIPSKKAWEAAQVEEERRLLYVAMTRARHALTLTWLEGTGDRPAAPSRFLQPFLQ